MGVAGRYRGASIGTLLIVVISATREWTPVLDPRLPVAAPLLGAVIGLVSGTYPALRAAPPGTRRCPALRDLKGAHDAHRAHSDRPRPRCSSALLAACGGGGAESDAHRRRQAAARSRRSWGSPPPRAPSAQAQVETDIAACMKAQGFEYTPVDPAARQAARRPGQASDEDFTRQFGYGIATLYGRGTAQADPNARIRQRLSEADRRA